MKGILYYFSGTGNTKWIADVFKRCFKRHNIDLDLLSIENIEEVKLKEFNFLIIGAPVYAEAQPRIVDNFLRKIPNSKKGLKTIVYATQGGNSSAAPYIMAKNLEKKGYKILVQAPIKMPNNYYFALGKEPTFNDQQEILINAENKIKKLVEDFMNNKMKKESSLVRMNLGKVCSKFFTRMLPKLSKNITATSDCMKCGLCLMNCPKSNITFEDGKAAFHSKCMLCLRCIYICPVNAVRYKGKKINQIQNERVKGVIKCQ